MNKIVLECINIVNSWTPEQVEKFNQEWELKALKNYSKEDKEMLGI